MVERVCACGCGRSLAGRQSNARFFESKCRQKDFNRRKFGGTVVGLVPSGVEVPSEGLLEAVRAELEGVGREDSYLGRAALVLAGRLDRSEGLAGVPPMVKELRETMVLALRGTEKTGKLLEMRRGRSGGKRDAKAVDAASS